MNKLLLLCLVSLIVTSQARLGGKNTKEEKMIGGWEEQDMNENSDYQQNENSPLNIVYKNILSLLEKNGITNINFYKVQSQLVNGINYRIYFTYEQDGQTKKGQFNAYIQPWTGDFKFTSISLQDKKEKSHLIGGWGEYEIDNNYQQNPDSPLYLASQLLSKKLSEKNLEFVRFDHIHSQLVSGILLNIKFTYKSNGEEKKGSSLIFVKSWQKFVKINKLILDESEEENESQDIQQDKEDNKKNLIGGWNTFDYEKDFQSNNLNSLYTTFNELNDSLSKNGVVFHDLISIERQLVNGFNYRINFSYLKLNGQMGRGKAIIYAPFNGKPKITNLKLENNLLRAESIDEGKNGGWEEIQFDEKSLSNSSSALALAHNELQKAMKQKGFRIEKIVKIQQQIVSGINYRIRFQYHSGETVKQGEAIIYVQVWTNTIEVKSLNLNMSAQV